MNEILTVKDLTKRYDTFCLDHISFSINEGTITGIVGPNGAGKSTTIKLLMNMFKPDHGSISIFGLDYKNSEQVIKNKVGYVGEEQFYYEDKSVKWIGKFVSHFYREWSQETFLNLLERFSVSLNKKVEELSKGMKVKLSLSIAMAHNPQLIILDEPTSGLDPVVRRELLDILYDFAKCENRSVIFSSHITEDLSRIADDLLFLVNGKIVLEGPKDALLDQYRTVRCKHDLDLGDLTPPSVSREVGEWKIALVDKDAVSDDRFKREIANGDLILEEASIDDILLSYVKRGLK